MKKGRQKEHKPGYKRNTIGWEQTCDCNDPEAVPATVLDPFCGSATTGVVANKLKRHFVGVDISEEYLDLAEERLTAGEWGVKVKREEEHAIPGFFGKE
jgi:ubiquinone/menaquinone biosynthesis C-methylase UbiE